LIVQLIEPVNTSVNILYCTLVHLMRTSAQSSDILSWLGLLTCKNRLPYNLYCVGGDVKHCSIQSNPYLYIRTL